MYLCLYLSIFLSLDLQADFGHFSSPEIVWKFWQLDRSNSTIVNKIYDGYTPDIKTIRNFCQLIYLAIKKNPFTCPASRIPVTFSICVGGKISALYPLSLPFPLFDLVHVQLGHWQDPVMSLLSG